MARDFTKRPAVSEHLLRTIDFHTHSGKSGVPGVNRSDYCANRQSCHPPRGRTGSHRPGALAMRMPHRVSWSNSSPRSVSSNRAPCRVLTGRTRLPGLSRAVGGEATGRGGKHQRGAASCAQSTALCGSERELFCRLALLTLHGNRIGNVSPRETTQRLSPLGVQHSRPVSSGTLIMSICATVGRPIITRIDTRCRRRLRLRCTRPSPDRQALSVLHPQIHRRRANSRHGPDRFNEPRTYRTN